MRLPLTARTRMALVVAAVALPAALATLAAPASAATAAATVDVPAYTLASTVSPAPLTASACAADATCVVAPAAKGGTADDSTALQQAITTAATKTRPAVVAADGTVTTAAITATVRVPAGTYRLTKGLNVPVNVNVRGAGINATMLVVDPTVNWKNFSYGFLLRRSDTKEAGSSNLISDLALNGNCRTGAGAFDQSTLPGKPGRPCDFLATTGAGPNTGGGVSVGDRWTVRQVRFTNFEYFKVWVHGSTGARIVDNRFDNRGGAESDGEDNIGGGGRNANTVIENNQFDATANGNSFDFTNAIGTVVRTNVVFTTPEVAAARGVLEYSNMYFEAVIGATVTGNTLRGAHIVLKSNEGYGHTGPNKDITNPRDTLVANNTILDSATVGIGIGYSDYTDADGTAGTPGGWNDSSTDAGDHVVRLGGNNIIRDNVIERSRETAILVYGSAATKNAGDVITGNRILNAGFGGSTAYNTGAGRFDTAGIGVGVGTGDAVYGNSITDNQDEPTTWYGVQVGARKSPGPSRIILTGPNGETNTTSGIIGAAVRTGVAAPEAPTALEATTSKTLTWEESYAMADNPVAGYRVFAGGEQIADLPVGSTAIPANLLDADASSLESAAGVSAWTAGSGTTLARSTTTGAVGGSSLALTATADGQISAYGKKSPVTAGTTYTSVSSFQAGTAGRRVRAGLAFTDANGKVTRLASSNKATVDTTDGWVTGSYSAVAPSGAVSVQAFLMVEGASAGETHYLDRMGLVSGTATEQFTSSSVLAGSYQVVAYRVGSFDFSAVTSVAVS
ncbi:hypothetical protein [Actinoplanes sp. NPDC051494]|uniref:hypothetical protein n=1 Tax=Actinoplanes sp. NPDC051494 TaxID=3363907 RepID=UPI00379A3E7C